MSIIALVKLSRNIKQVWVFIFSDQDLTFVFFEISITSSAWKWKCKSTLVVSRFNPVFFWTWNQKLAWKPFFAIFRFFFHRAKSFFNPSFYYFIRIFYAHFYFSRLCILFFHGQKPNFSRSWFREFPRWLLFLTSSL